MSDIVLPNTTLQHSHAHSDTPDLHRSHDTRVTQTEPIIPASWSPPSSLFPRCIFCILCLVLTLHPNLNFMWRIFRKKEGWKNFHTTYLKQIKQLSIVQGLILSSVAVFISAPPPLKQTNYTVDQIYSVLSESLMLSLFGLLSQLFISIQGWTFVQQKSFEALKQTRWLFICHMILLLIPFYIFGMSIMLLIFALYMTGLTSSSQSLTKVTFVLLMLYPVLGIAQCQPLFSLLVEKSIFLKNWLWKQRSKEAESPV